ncbi:arsenate reductase/protein-tyrosine-phosphatase family protein [Brachybacterium hainanense]|uniref:protein-tyrosine-phosphatase n=1 Tax=Brachybacterium hainanense TaxID=1541174 RepID=A0ABV6RFH8_9MICO
MPALRVLTVCTGNVCRSPAAAVMLREEVRADARLAGQVEVQSAGLSWEAEGEPMDSRTVLALEHAGYTQPFEHTARSIHQSELPGWDLLLPMTTDHEAALRRKADQVPAEQAVPQIALWLAFDPAVPGDASDEERSVPDPWYEGQEEFDRTVARMRAALPGLREHLVSLLAGRPRDEEPAQA